MGTAVDERRKRHLKALEARHREEFDKEHGREKTRKDAKREALADAMSALWNKSRSGTERLGSAEATASDGQKGPLPEGWREAHWKTLQAMAAEFAGAETSNKDESIQALEAYEARVSK
ncbi:hypothetical protein [Labrenzia sp. OB1]|uniref:hypothetical protein n=1 Tax=Labrenzia sp. OB1 TaxID=1561204 RepID=UPI0007B211F6|nr:hypothetical protein [Labrenzia sp. OB1]KZM47496.1 hypothetical protein OA90_25530 [Labrenzia sp. OB1]